MLVARPAAQFILNKPSKYISSVTFILLLASTGVTSAQNSSVTRIQSQLKTNGNSDQALSELMEILAREKDNVEAHILTGKLLRKKGFEKLADEQFRLADQLDPSLPDSKISQFKLKLKQEGESAAMGYLCQLEQSEPDSPSVLVMYGIIEDARKQNERAKLHFQKALEEHPEMPGLSSVIAFVFLENHKYGQAIALANKDLVLKKDHPAANLAKGEALLSLGRSQEALPYLQLAYNSPASGRLRSAGSLSRAYIANGLSGDALEPTLICLALTPADRPLDFMRIKNNFALVFDSTSKREVLNVLKVVMKLIDDPQIQSRLNYTVGNFLAQRGFFSESEQLLQESLKLDQQNSQLCLNLGLLMERRGDYQKAKSYYERASSLNPYDSVLAAKLARIYKLDSIRSRDIARHIKDCIRSERERS